MSLATWILWAFVAILTVWAYVQHNAFSWLGVMILVVTAIVHREDIRAAIRKFKGRSQ